MLRQLEQTEAFVPTTNQLFEESHQIVEHLGHCKFCKYERQAEKVKAMRFSSRSPFGRFFWTISCSGTRGAFRRLRSCFVCARRCTCSAPLFPPPVFQCLCSALYAEAQILLLQTLEATNSLQRDCLVGRRSRSR